MRGVVPIFSSYGTINLLFVFSDQQRYTALGANGNPVVRTPNLDRMAAEGMVCDNMFSNHPLCSPFRAILLNALNRLEIADDTIVCYSSDHGDHLSSHGYGKPADLWMHPSMRASKATPYDESAHIPFVIRWPGVTTPGSRRARKAHPARVRHWRQSRWTRVSPLSLRVAIRAVQWRYSRLGCEGYRRLTA